MSNILEIQAIDYVGIITDIHCRLDIVDSILKIEKDITQWICLGDVVDMYDRNKSKEVLNAWPTYNIPTIMGNHELAILEAIGSPYIKTLQRAARIVFPNCDEYLCYHSKPHDMYTFIDPHFTEREFIDTYPLYHSCIKGVIVGHNHKQFKLEFPYTDPVIYSPGATKESCYGILSNNSFEFKRITS